MYDGRCSTCGSYSCSCNISIKIDRLTLAAAETLALKAIWSKAGYVRQAVDADLMADLLKRLHLGPAYTMTDAEMLDDAMNGRR